MKVKLRRRSLALVCAGAVVVLGASIPAATAKTQATTIQFVSQNTLTPAFQVLIANFNRIYPDIEVKATYLPSDQYNTLITTQLAAGGGPDVFIGFPSTGALPSIQLMAQAGYLADLSGRPWGKRVPTDAKTGNSVGNKLYGWPLGQAVYFLMYNKAEFTRLGLKVPATYSGMLSVCKKIKAAGKIPLAQAGAVSPNNGVMASQLAASTVYWGDPTWNAKRLAGKVAFASTAGWSTALGFISDLSKGGCFAPGVQGVSVPDATRQFATGQALMWIQNTQSIGLVRAANPTFPLGIAPTPAPTLKQQVTMIAFPNNLVVNAKSSNLDAAKTFVDFMAREKQSRLWAKVSGLVAPFDASRGILPDDLKPLAANFTAKRLRPNAIFVWPKPSVFQTISTQVQGLLTGQLTPADALKATDTNYDAK